MTAATTTDPRPRIYRGAAACLALLAAYAPSTGAGTRAAQARAIRRGIARARGAA